MISNCILFYILCYPLLLSPAENVGLSFNVGGSLIKAAG